MLPVIRKVLYATDLSEGAKHAVWYAAGIADKYQAEVTVLHVVSDVAEELSEGAGIDMTAHFGADALEGFNKQSLDQAKQAVLKRIEEICQEAGAELQHCPLEPDHIIVEIGKPSEVIVKTAQSNDYDLVVMGTHGHGVFSEIMLGSVAHNVIKRCSKPVLVVRLPHA